MTDSMILVAIPEKSFWCLQPLISREIEAVSRRMRANPAEDHSKYADQLQRCLGAVSSAMREFHEQQKGMFRVSEALRTDDEAAP